MTSFEMTATRSANEATAMSSGLLGQLAGMVRLARARRELMELDDRLLRDIGLNRHDLAAGPTAMW